MESQSPKWRRFALSVFACVAVASLMGASTAFAVQTDFYDPFLNETSCPTSGPFLSNPEFPEVGCLATTNDSGFLKIGGLETPTAGASIGFAVAPELTEPETCGGPGSECLRSVPGSTVITADPIKIPLPGFRPGHFIGRRHSGHGPHGNGHSKPRVVRATIEAAGDVHALSFFDGFERPIMKAPIKVHLEGRHLGRHCYIGSDEDPIELALLMVGEPEGELFEDPNGFPVFGLALHGFDAVDPAFAVPAARGCGPAVGPAKKKVHPLDGLLNAILGLPSPSGSNLLALADDRLTAVISISGGAGLKAAFDAAQLP